MKTRRRSRWLARLAATLTVGMAGVPAGPVSSQPAWARDTGTVIQSHLVASWGLNAYGELGDGTTTDRNTPVQVAGLTRITQVAAGNEFSLALRSDGTV